MGASPKKTTKKSRIKNGEKPARVRKPTPNGGAKKDAPVKASPHRANAAQQPRHSLQAKVQAALASLQRMSTQRDRDNLQRFAIMSPEKSAGKAFGVSMANMKAIAKRLGPNHELAAALWETGWYEARMLATLVDEPERVTAAQMDRWCRDFDNWAICDTACFCLFDKSPLAWKKAAPWARPRGDREFVKRTGFVLMACLALHDKGANDAKFMDFLPLIEEGAHDDRNFVKKGVSWALRAIGERRNTLNAAAVATAQRLALSKEPSCRWVGKDALRQLATPQVRTRLARQAN